MRYNQIVRAKGGTDRHIQDVNEIKILDLWHTATKIEALVQERDDRPLTEEDAEAVLETWALCNDLLAHIKRVCVEPKTE